jgi:hypothetical protein
VFLRRGCSILQSVEKNLCPQMHYWRGFQNGGLSFCKKIWNRSLFPPIFAARFGKKESKKRVEKGVPQATKLIT